MAIAKRLPALLASYSVSAIRRMVEGRVVPLPAGGKKAAALAALELAAAKPASVAAALAALSPNQRALLDLLLAYPGEIQQNYVRGLGEAAGLLQEDRKSGVSDYYFSYMTRLEAGDPAAGQSRRLADLLAGLSYRLLALTTGSSYTPTLELGLGELITVPGEIRPALVGATAPDVPLAPTPGGPPEHVAPRYAHRALFLLWASLRSKPAGLTQAGLVRKLDARRLGQALGVATKTTEFNAETDLRYLYFLRRVAGRVGLLAARDGQLEAAPRERLQDFTAAAWPERSLRLLRAWVQSTAEDLASAPAAGDWRRGRSLPEPNARAGLAHLLARVAGLPDAWIGLDGFVRWMRLHYFGFLALPDADPLAVHDFGTGLFHLPYGALPTSDPWEATEGLTIRESLRGALHWLGLVDLAGAGAAQAFRLTPLGRTLLDALGHPARAAALLAPLGAQETPGRVVVQPNFQVLAVGEVPDELLFALSDVAELVRADQVIEFKLTQPAIYAAQQAGWTPIAILDLLRRATGGAVAQNVERSILDWAAAHERIVVRRDATLLVARDAVLLDRLAADPEVAPLLGERLLPTLILVRPGAAGPAASLTELDRHLLAGGELPARSDLAEDVPEPSFVFDDAGAVSWPGPLPDLRLLGLLASIARPTAEGRLVLDERTVRQTAATRHWQPADVTALLARLAAWHIGALPPAVERQIKIWAGYQGRAAFAPVTLLTVERPELLAELQADPALAPLLVPPAQGTVAILLPGSDGATARDTVRQVLLARGFTLDEA